MENKPYNDLKRLFILLILAILIMSTLPAIGVSADSENNVPNAGKHNSPIAVTIPMDQIIGYSDTLTSTLRCATIAAAYVIVFTVPVSLARIFWNSKGYQRHLTAGDTIASFHHVAYAAVAKAVAAISSIVIVYKYSGDTRNTYSSMNAL